MKFSVILLTSDDAQAAMIVSILSESRIIRCRTGEEAMAACRDQNVCLALIADNQTGIDSRQVFADLGTVQPGITGILLSASADKLLLHSALETGFSGLVQLPVNAGQLTRVVKQALERFRLQQENIRLRTLLPLYSLGEQFFSAGSEQEVLDGLIEAVHRQAEKSSISVMLYNAEDGCLRIAAARGMDPRLVQSIKLYPGDQIAGWVFQQGKPVILNKEDQNASIFSPLLQQTDIVSAISFPLMIRKRIIGVLNISQKETDERFSDADYEMLAIICSQAAVALENVRAQHQLTATTRMRTLFEQYVAPEVAELLIAQNSDLMGLGEVKEVTVLFADIRNFTRLVQYVDLQMLRAFLNEFFQFFTEEVFQHRGTVDKFMGDAVLAVFGAPVKLEQPNLAATRTALAVKARFADLRDQWGERCEDFKSVDLGIAVTSGDVFLGNLGSARRFDYTVIGNEVNIAQRLASESSACRIYTTDTVRRDIENSFAIEELGEIQLRGVEKKTRVFAINSARQPGVIAGPDTSKPYDNDDEVFLR